MSSSTLSLHPPGTIGYVQNVTADPSSPSYAHEEENLRAVFASMDELMRTPTLVGGAVMPDACPTGTGTIPVGGVAISQGAIHPGFHSSDICCSVMATNFGSEHDPLNILNAAERITHFGVGGRKRSAGLFKHLDPQLEARIRSNSLFSESDFKKAQRHLGTQGDGNHFLFVGRSEADGGVTVVTHHGSRAFGASLYQRGMQIANQYRESLSPETLAENAWIPARSPDGERYWDALQIIRDWTRLNHELIHRLIAQKIGHAFSGIHGEGATFWNEHNFVFRQPDPAGGEDLFFHAKGATPLDDAFLPDSHAGLRLIPLNMSQPILVVRGDSTCRNLGFAPHGAGRNMTRTQHKQLRRGAGKTDAEIFQEETADIDVRFFSKTVDISELPSAYKNAEQVQQQIDTFGLGTVHDRIHPYGCIMAGAVTPQPRRRSL